MRHTILLTALVLGLLSLGGCDDVYLSDDIDLELNFSLLKGPSDALHAPYVLGTKVNIYANSEDSEQDTSSFWLESSDPKVLRIDHQAGGSAHCLAEGVGMAELRLYAAKGDPNPLHSAWVDVRKPTRVELFAHGKLLLGRPEVEARTHKPVLLNDGTATFLVRYFAGNVILSGNGVLSATAQTSVELEEETSYLFENREWLRIRPRAPGLHRVTLMASGVPVGTVDVQSVTSAAISYATLRGEDERRAENGEWLVVLARALDKNSSDIFGVSFGWQLDGAKQEGHGDLFRYKFARDMPRALTASHDSVSSLATINASEGYVDSSNHIGCSTAPAAPGQGSPLMPAALLLAVGAVILRRRRR
jgi:MYXO-CTERM domain-containing protein